MRDLNELQLNEGGRPVQRPAPSASDIASFEAAAGFPLPEEYLQLLRHSNGGHPFLDTFEARGNGDFAIDRFYHLDGADRSSPMSLFSILKTWSTVLGPNRLPIATDGGGNQIFLEAAEGAVAVSLYLHDLEKVIPVAASFSAFIDSLKLDPDCL